MLEYSFPVHIMFIAVEKSKCACRITAPALQLSATLTNTLLMAWLCCHTLHFCILVTPTHCSHVHLFSHTRESWIWQNSAQALALEDTWAVQWKVVLKGLWLFSRVTRCAELLPVLIPIASSHTLGQKCHLHWWKKSLSSSNSWMGILLKWWASWVYFALVRRCSVAHTGRAGHRHLRI